MSVFFLQTTLFGNLKRFNARRQICFAESIPTTVKALNSLVSFPPRRESPPDIRKDKSRRDQLERSKRGSKAEIQCNGCSARANRTADRIFGYGLVGLGLICGLEKRFLNADISSAV